jgi:hypothetical protein
MAYYRPLYFCQFVPEAPAWSVPEAAAGCARELVVAVRLQAAKVRWGASEPMHIPGRYQQVYERAEFALRQITSGRGEDMIGREGGASLRKEAMRMIPGYYTQDELNWLGHAIQYAAEVAWAVTASRKRWQSLDLALCGLAIEARRFGLQIDDCQMRWRAHDAFRSTTVPEDHRLAFEAAWLAGEGFVAYRLAKSLRPRGKRAVAA